LFFYFVRNYRAAKKQPGHPDEQCPDSIGKDIQTADKTTGNEGLMEFVGNPVHQTPQNGEHHHRTRPELRHPLSKRPDQRCGKQSIDHQMSDFINSRQSR